MIKQLRIFSCLTVCLFVVFVSSALAQEGLRSLNSNLSYYYRDLTPARHPITFSSQQLGAKSNSTSIFLPFKDDFSYSPTNQYARQDLWKDSTVYINSGFAIAPPSIGVATFDGLNKHGYPYTPALIDQTASKPADTLTSRPINLLVTATSQTLQPSDSIAISFYYQARGNGEPPDITDSIILDFFKPAQKKWVSRVWFSKGNANANINDTVFKRGFVWIKDTDYLHTDFQFRFRNRATTLGDFDHWHLDYVYLDKNRSMKADTAYNDIAITYVPTSYLSDYCSMPWQQFSLADIAPKNSVKIRNNSNIALNYTYENRLSKNNVQLSSYTGGPTNLCPFKPANCGSTGYSAFAPHANPNITYTFTSLGDSADFTIKHYIALTGSSTDFIRENDTVLQFQRFRNYYAFDDGSAEGGYYVNGTGGKMACKIKLNAPDVLQSVRIYFDPVGSVPEAETSYSFFVVVWADGGNGPGVELFRSANSVPKYYNICYKEFPEFQLTNDPSLRSLGAGTYYIGIQQQVASGITVGFDKNSDHHTSTYFDSGNGWTQSVFKGSLMIRPVFGAAVPHGQVTPCTDIRETNFTQRVNNVLTYPNPATDVLVIESQTHEDTNFELYNLLGQPLLAGNIDGPEHPVNVNHLGSGVYLLLIKRGSAVLQTQRIIIQR